MEEHRRQVVCGATQIIAILALIYLFYNQSSKFDYTSIAPFFGNQNLSNWEATNPSPSKVVLNNHLQPSLKSLLSTLVQGEDGRKLETTGFACDSAVYSLVCVASNPVKIDTKTMEIILATDQFNVTHNNISIEGDGEKVVQVRPYAWQHDYDLLKFVTPVKFVTSKSIKTSSLCEYNHNMPAVVFSSSGFTGNLFHEFNEIIIPLFITSRFFESNVQFILLDYNPSFVEKFNLFFSSLSPYEILNPIVNKSVHCFTGAVVGLKFHNFLSINSTEIPKGNSMLEFRKFLGSAYNLNIHNVSETGRERPVLILVSRGRTRLFLNEDEMVEMMKELGFEVVVVGVKKMSNLSEFGKMVSTCSVMVGAHGAGLTNEVFLPAGAVVVQVVPLGLEWPSTVYFGEPAVEMGLHYLDYKIEPEESSLLESYGRDDPVVVDPGSVFAKGYQVGREVYLVRQNIRVNVERFRGTILEALRLLGRTTPLGAH